MKGNIAAVFAVAAALGVGLTAQTPAPQTSASPETVTVTGCIQPGAAGANPAEAGAVATSGPSQFVLMNPVVGSSAGTAGAISGSAGATANPPRPGTTSAPSPTEPSPTTTPATPPSAMPPPPAAPTTTPPSTSPSPNPTGTTGTPPPSATGANPAGAGAASATPNQFRLTGGQDLQQFVNQQVEIRGTFQENAATAPGTAPTASATGATDVAGTQPAQTATRTLRITSVRLLGGTCPGTPR